MTALDIVVPLLSVAVGAGITYWINVRERRRTYVEDLFNVAIADVSAAAASVDYTSLVGRPVGMNDDSYESLVQWMLTEAIKPWTVKTATANQSLSRIAPYLADAKRAQLERLLPFRPVDDGNRAHEPIIELLRRSRPKRR